jgi:hypothetical protein
MYHVTLELYTATEIHAAAVPLLVDGLLNPDIPEAAGIYVFPGRSKIFYVGKTGRSLSKRLKDYRRETIFRRVWWHVIEPAWVDTYEMLYLQTLRLTLNGLYHVGPREKVDFRGKRVYERELT